MTADEARGLTKATVQADAGLVEAVLDTWYRSIKAACIRGEEVVHDHQVSRLRTPVPPAVTRAVFDRLRADGFTISSLQAEYYSVSVAVSWAPPAGRILPPQGGSGIRDPAARTAAGPSNS